MSHVNGVLVRKNDSVAMCPAKHTSTVPWPLRVQLMAMFVCAPDGNNDLLFSCPFLSTALIRELEGCQLTTLPAGVFSPLANLAEM